MSDNQPRFSIVAAFFGWLCGLDHWARKPLWTLTCPIYFIAVIATQKKDYDWIAFTRFDYWDFNWRLFWATYDGHFVNRKR